MALTENGVKLLDIGVKGVLGTVIAGAVAYYGNVLQDQRARVQDENRQVQATIELTSRQKDLDVELGMRLFGTLMTYYFQQGQPADRAQAVHKQLLLLRLVALNFQDVPINLKPLFEDLDSQLTSDEEKQALRDIAQEVAGRQAYRMTLEGGYDSGPREVRAGDKLSVPELLTNVKIARISAEGVSATISSSMIGDRHIGPFTVTYFDTPLVDNTKLGEYRVALILQKLNAEQATVRFVAFPKHLASDRFDIKDLSRKFRDARLH
jgi:hypothetical protein